VRVTGHAVEARIYAESAERGFLPATGTVLVYDDAGVGAGPGAAPLRLDSGIQAGTTVTGDFDPLLAKAVAHGADRGQALDRLDGLLRSVTVLGVETNQAFLRDLLADDDVRAGRLDTGLIERLLAARSPAAPDGELLTAAALVTMSRDGTSAAGPWAAADGWRLNGPPATRRVALVDAGGAEHAVLVSGTADDAVVTVGDHDPVPASLRPAGGPGAWLLTLDGVLRTVRAAVTDANDDGGAALWVASQGATLRASVLGRAEQSARRRAARTPSGAPGRGPSGEVCAAMPGTVSAVLVDDGASVEPGATVVVVEAMKMEHPLTAPHGGTVRLRVRPGDQVRADQVVAVVEARAAATASNGTTSHGAAHPAAPAPHSATRGAS
jgi:acetyl-CoA/propionyl-CoA carboxylase biotin carboxyl carrier protein